MPSLTKSCIIGGKHVAAQDARRSLAGDAFYIYIDVLDAMSTAERPFTEKMQPTVRQVTVFIIVV